MSQFVLRSYISNYFGYGMHGLQILKDFTSFGYDVRVVPMTLDLRDTEFRQAVTEDTELVKRCISPDKNPNFKRELVLGLPYQEFPQDNRKRVFFTMWETNRIPRKGVDNLNRVSHVVVPCEWNACSFNACGVARPISISQLGIDTSVYNPLPKPTEGLCVFGTGGRLTAGGIRKNIADMPKIFADAFPDQKDVRLLLKTFPDEAVPETFDPRVEITNRFLSPRDMAQWYARLTVYVSVSNSEGWGLMPHQAMAVGRPALAPRFGGMREYFDDSVGYPVDFKLVPCGGIYAQDDFSAGGYWAEINRDDLIDKMRWVYNNQDKVAEMGKIASARAMKYSWTAAHRRLEKVLKDAHFFD